MLNQLRNPFVALPLVLFVIAASFAAYFYTQLAELKQDPQKIAQQEAEELVKRVGELTVLPEGEQPTIATVTDPKLLKTQPFFKEAKVGYKVLMYAKAQKAILYDPVNHTIVAVAPLNIGENSLIPLLPE